LKNKLFFVNSAFMLFVFFLLAGCAKSPKDVYAAMQKSAMKGDYDTFAGYFTKKSQPFVRALIELQKTDFGGDQGASIPLKILTECTVTGKQKLQSSQIVLSLDCGDNKARELAFLKENGKWRADIKLTEDLRIHAKGAH